MSPGTSDAFLTDDSAQVTPQPDIPDPPDFARVIPISAIQDARNQQQADEWASQQRQDLAQQWASVAKQQVDDMVSGWQNGVQTAYGVDPLAQGIAAPEGTSVEPILSETGTQLQGPPADQGQTQTIDLSPGQTGSPAPGLDRMQDATSPTGSASSSSQPITMDGLADLFRKAIGQGAGGAGLVDVTKPPSSVGEAAVDAAQAEAQRTKPIMGPAGPTIFNPNTPAGGLGGEAPAARLASNAGEDAGAVAAAAGQAAETASQEAPAITAGSREALDLVTQHATANAGDQADVVQQARALVDKTKNWDSIMKNPGRWVGLVKPENQPIRQAAVDMVKASRDQGLLDQLAQVQHPGPNAIPPSVPDADIWNSVPGMFYKPTTDLSPSEQQAVYRTRLRQTQGGLNPTEAAAPGEGELAHLLGKENRTPGIAPAEAEAALDRYNEAAAEFQKTGQVPDGYQVNPDMNSPRSLVPTDPDEAAALAAAKRTVSPGAMTLEEAQASLPPVQKSMLDRLFGPSKDNSNLGQVGIIRAINGVQGILKQAVIGASVFHPLVESAQLERTAMAAGKPLAGVGSVAAANRALVDSGFAQRYAAENADVIERAKEAGATMMDFRGPISPDVQQVGNRITRTLLSSAGAGVMGYASGKAQGESDQDALKRGALFAAGGAGVAQVAPLVNRVLWGQMVPVAKTEAFKMLEPQYGAEVAAKRVNDIFGGQNLEKLGRNPELQTVLRTTFLAPDWLESWARNAGATFTKGPEGDAARKYWLATGVSAVLGLEGLSMAINGKPTTDNDQGRQLQLEITPLLKAAGYNPPQRVYVDVLQLGPLGSVLNAATRGGIGAVGANLATGHLNTLPGIAWDAIQNRAPTGGQIVSEGTPGEQSAMPEVAAAGAHAAPIGVSAFQKSDLPVPVEAASGVTGLRTVEGPAVKPKATPKMAGPFGKPAPAAPARAANLHNWLSPAPKKQAQPGPFTSKRSNLRNWTGK